MPATQRGPSGGPRAGRAWRSPAAASAAPPSPSASCRRWREFGLLRDVDYLSTVSGGGYIGGWLTATAGAPATRGDWLGAATPLERVDSPPAALLQLPVAGCRLLQRRHVVDGHGLAAQRAARAEDRVIWPWPASCLPRPSSYVFRRWPTPGTGAGSASSCSSWHRRHRRQPDAGQQRRRVAGGCCGPQLAARAGLERAAAWRVYGSALDRLRPCGRRWIHRYAARPIAACSAGRLRICRSAVRLVRWRGSGVDADADQLQAGAGAGSAIVVPLLLPALVGAICGSQRHHAARLAASRPTASSWPGRGAIGRFRLSVVFCVALAAVVLLVRPYATEGPAPRCWPPFCLASCCTGCSAAIMLLLQRWASDGRTRSCGRRRSSLSLLAHDHRADRHDGPAVARGRPRVVEPAGRVAHHLRRGVDDRRGRRGVRSAAGRPRVQRAPVEGAVAAAAGLARSSPASSAGHSDRPAATRDEERGSKARGRRRRGAVCVHRRRCSSASRHAARQSSGQLRRMTWYDRWARSLERCRRTPRSFACRWRCSPSAAALLLLGGARRHQRVQPERVLPQPAGALLSRRHAPRPRRAQSTELHRLRRDDDLPLADLVGGRPLAGPLHIVNCALNLGGSSDLALHTRHSASFTLTPLACGSAYQLARPSGAEASSSATRDRAYGGRAGAPTLGPGDLGVRRRGQPEHGLPHVAGRGVPADVFNLRLGWWFPNPGRAGVRTASPRFSLRYMFAELFGGATDRSGSSWCRTAATSRTSPSTSWSGAVRVIITSDAECDPSSVRGARHADSHVRGRLRRAASHRRRSLRPRRTSPWSASAARWDDRLRDGDRPAR